MLTAIIALNDVKNGLMACYSSKRKRRNLIQKGILGIFRTVMAFSVYGACYAVEYRLNHRALKWVLRSCIFLVSPRASFEVLIAIQAISGWNKIRESKELLRVLQAKCNPIYEKASEELLNQSGPSNIQIPNQWWTNRCYFMPIELYKKFVGLRDQILKAEGTYEEFILQTEVIRRVKRASVLHLFVTATSTISRLWLELIANDLYRWNFRWHDPLGVDKKLQNWS
jgi:hypothetical protein